jgi:TatA/E family protein of Tat protein translocase
MPDILFILLLTLVIFGPKKLPEMARQLGKYVAHFKRLRSEFTNQIESEMLKIDAENDAKATANPRA